MIPVFDYDILQSGVIQNSFNLKILIVIGNNRNSKMNHPENVSITPWFTKQEWIKVAYCIVTATDSKIAEKHFQDDTNFKNYSSKDQVELYLRAIEDIDVWKTRTNKLPAGVETTLCLLHGAITHAKSTDNSIFRSRASVQLCLATAINRFLNLICHTGFNLFGLTKYYDVAESPEGTSLLDTYKIDSGGDRMPVELIDSAINVPKSDEKVEPSIDRYFCHLKNSKNSNIFCGKIPISSC